MTGHRCATCDAPAYIGFRRWLGDRFDTAVRWFCHEHKVEPELAHYAVLPRRLGGLA